MDRRKFINRLGTVSGGMLLANTELSFAGNLLQEQKEDLTFGIVADAHHGLMPDVYKRLEKFIEEAINRKVDFIIQMGDFCFAGEKSKDFLKLWNQFQNPKYHVLGNHDMDFETKAEIMDFWEMPKNYYAFEQKGVRFIVLDANFLYKEGKYIDYAKSNFYVPDEYRTFINPEQIEWFAAELEASELPTIIYSHQSLWHYQWGVKNRLTLQRHMEKHRDKIICCLNGHNHIDFHHHQNGIDYLEINSLSYHWVGEKYKVKRYPEALEKEYKFLRQMAPYQDPLYAFATIKPKGEMMVEGVRSKWLAPSPFEAGMPEQVLGMQPSPVISNYKLEF